MVAVKKCHKLDSLKNEKFTISQFCRLEVWNQTVRAMLPLGDNFPLFLPSFWQWLSILGAYWFASVLLQSLRCCPMAFSLVSSVTSYEDSGHTGLRAHPVPIWLHLNWLYLQRLDFQTMCWKFALQHIFWGNTIQPTSVVWGEITENDNEILLRQFANRGPGIWVGARGKVTIWFFCFCLKIFV